MWQKNVGAFPVLFRVITLSRAHDLNKKYFINMKCDYVKAPHHELHGEYPI